jgi:hypothetical protein
MINGLFGRAKTYQRSDGQSISTINGLHMRSGSLRKGLTPVLPQRVSYRTGPLLNEISHATHWTCDKGQTRILHGGRCTRRTPDFLPGCHLILPRIVTLSQRRRICVQVEYSGAAKSLCLLSPDVEASCPTLSYL